MTNSKITKKIIEYTYLICDILIFIINNNINILNYIVIVFYDNEIIIKNKYYIIID